MGLAAMQTENSRQSGFTLVEVLIAMAITAIAAIIAYSGLDSAIKLAGSAEVEMDRLQKINRVFDIMTRDFRHVLPRMVRSPDGDDYEHALFFNESSSPLLGFSRNGWTNPQPERFQRSQMQRVSYHLEEGKLTRSSWQMMDRYNDSEKQEFVLLENVTAFKVRGLMSNPKAVGGSLDFSNTTWVTSWPPPDYMESSALNTLPVALEVSLEVEGWGEIRRLFELVDNEQ